MQEWVLGSHKSSGGMIHHPRTRGNERRRPTGAAEGEVRRIHILGTSVNKADPASSTPLQLLCSVQKAHLGLQRAR